MHVSTLTADTGLNTPLVDVHPVTLDFVVAAAALDPIIATCYVDTVSHRGRRGVPDTWNNGRGQVHRWRSRKWTYLLPCLNKMIYNLFMNRIIFWPTAHNPPINHHACLYHEFIPGAGVGFYSLWTRPGWRSVYASSHQKFMRHGRFKQRHSRLIVCLGTKSSGCTWRSIDKETADDLVESNTFFTASYQADSHEGGIDLLDGAVHTEHLASVIHVNQVCILQLSRFNLLRAFEGVCTSVSGCFIVHW